MTWTTTMIKSLEHLTNKEAAEKYGMTTAAVSCAQVSQRNQMQETLIPQTQPGATPVFR